MRCWLPVLYKDLYHIPASHYSIDPGNWKHVIDCLDDNWFSFEPLLVLEFLLGALYLQFAIKRSIAKLIFINFIYLSVELGYVLKTPTPFDEY